MFRMKTTKRTADDFRLKAIFIHFQPIRRGYDRELPPGFRAGIRALAQTLPGQKRDKQKDAWEAERNWNRNLSFMAGVYTLIPPDDSVLKIEAERLLLKMFGKGFPKNKDKLERFNTAERRRIRKDGDAAWRLIEKIRRRLKG
jgi:hypothetical protein